VFKILIQIVDFQANILYFSTKISRKAKIESGANKQLLSNADQ